MNLFNRTGNAEQAEHDENCKLLMEFAERHPILAEQFLGIPESPGVARIEPASVRLFLNGGRMKAQISPRKSFDSIFCVVNDLSSPVFSIELELQAGRYEFKRASEQKAPY